MSTPELFPLDHDAFTADIRVIAAKVANDRDWQPTCLIGVGRGGLVPGAYLSHALGMTLLSVDYSSKDFGFADELIHKLAYRTRQGEKLLVGDDINDSGRTIEQLRSSLSRFGGIEDNVRVAVVLNNSRSAAKADYWSQEIDRDVDKRWFVFPWEAMAPSETLVEEALEVPERLGG